MVFEATFAGCSDVMDWATFVLVHSGPDPGPSVRIEQVKRWSCAVEAVEGETADLPRSAMG